jgi:hypothetical protein
MRLIWEEEERLKRLLAEVDSWDRSRRVRAYIRHVALKTHEAARPLQRHHAEDMERVKERLAELVRFLRPQES